MRTIHTPLYPATDNIGRAHERGPEDGVVSVFGQAHDVPNLLVSDASRSTTGAAENPTLTIIASAPEQTAEPVHAP